MILKIFLVLCFLIFNFNFRIFIFIIYQLHFGIFQIFCFLIYQNLCSIFLTFFFFRLFYGFFLLVLSSFNCLLFFLNLHIFIFWHVNVSVALLRVALFSGYLMLFLALIVHGNFLNCT